MCGPVLTLLKVVVRVSSTERFPGAEVWSVTFMYFVSRHSHRLRGPDYAPFQGTKEL